MRWYIRTHMVRLVLVSIALAACGPAADRRQPDAPSPAQPSPTATPTQALDAPRAGTGVVSTVRPPALKVEVAWTVERDPERPRLPVALALGPAGQLYLVDGGRQRIEVFDRDGRVLAGWGGEGADAGQFRFRLPDRCPDFDHGDCVPDVGGGAAVDGQGRVYVADYANHRIQVFDASGSLLLGWGREGSGPGEFRLTGGIAVDRRGQVYVSDIGNRRIQVFDGTGRFVTEWGRSGKDADRFMTPGALAVDAQGWVAMVELQNNRVQQFDGHGRFVWQWAADRPISTIQQGSAIAADGQGHLYVTGAGGGIRKLDEAGQVVASWGGGGPWDVKLEQPTGIAVDEEGAIYVAERDGGRLLKVRQLLPVPS